MARHSNKQAILDAGLRVMFRQGFHGTAVRDVVAAAGVPQGSFTNHFPSKEQFAGEVLARYFDHVKQMVESSLGNRGLRPRERLERYLDGIVERLAADGYARGCLIGDLSNEITQTSDPIRQQLHGLFEQWIDPFAECIAEGQAIGEFDKRFEARELAEFFLASWQGAILRMKVERSVAPLLRFRKIVFSNVLNKGANDV